MVLADNKSPENTQNCKDFSLHTGKKNFICFYQDIFDISEFIHVIRTL